MKIALAAVLAAGILACAPAALADDSAADLRVGQAGTLVNGDVVQTWTISSLRRSGDSIPRAIDGTLWEATATNTAVAGSVIPIIPNFNARAGGDNYRVLFGVATTQGINPATLAQGEKSSGKLYFDIPDGVTPDRVVFNDGEADRLVWINAPEPVVSGPPSVQSAAPLSTKPAGSPTPAQPAQTPSAAGAPATSSTPAATGQGTPAATSQGTPAATSQGTPATAGTPSASTPAASPAPTSQGTPATAGTPSAAPAAPAASQPAPAGAPSAATSQGTPATPTASPGATSSTGTPAEPASAAAGAPANAAGTASTQPSPAAAPTTVIPTPTQAATSAGTPAG